MKARPRRHHDRGRRRGAAAGLSTELEGAGAEAIFPPGTVIAEAAELLLDQAQPAARTWPPGGGMIMRAAKPDREIRQRHGCERFLRPALHNGRPAIAAWPGVNPGDGLVRVDNPILANAMAGIKPSFQPSIVRQAGGGNLDQNNTSSGRGWAKVLRRDVVD